MTPKEKARELVQKFTLMLSPDYYQQEAKQCALICVDEILETYIDLDPKLNYWKVVKQEINKM